MPTRTGKVGRPTKWTPKVQEAYIRALSSGMSRAGAAELVGIGESSVYNWLNRGAEGEEPYVQFLEAVTHEEARLEEALIKQWKAHGAMDWRAIRDFCERRYAKRWGKPKDTVEVSTPDGKPLVVILPALEADE